MNKELLECIQEQINAEFYSSALYFSMSSWSERKGLKGFANWFRVQAQEELYHATFMHDYLIRRGEVSVMKTVAAPPSEWESIQTAFEQVCSHEQFVTDRINNISSIALDNRDHATYQFFYAVCGRAGGRGRVCRRNPAEDYVFAEQAGVYICAGCRAGSPGIYPAVYSRLRLAGPCMNRQQ